MNTRFIYVAGWAAILALFLFTPARVQAIQEDAASSEAVEPLIPADQLEQMISLARDDSHVMDHLDHLCNRIGPRLSGSDGLQVACEWAASQFEELGLETSIEQWGEFPVGFNRGPSFGRVLEPSSMQLEFGTDAWTAGTRGRSHGRATIAPQTEEEWETAAEDLKNKWVLVPAVVGERPSTREEFNRMRAERNAMMQRVREAEPLGIIEPTRDELIVTSGNYRQDWENLPTIPQIDLRVDQFNELVEMIEADESVVLEFDIRNFFTKGPIPLYNVIADIPGTEFPDEYVIVGGHLDSWDAATGATDNASGCATTLEVARILMESEFKPRRTIRFMLWTGEEQGLLGSRAYVEANPDVVEKVSAVLVHDGGTNYVSGIRALEDQIPDLERVFAPAMTLDDRLPFDIERVEVMRGGGSDHSSFIRGGAPGFFWKQSGRAVYRQTHHTQYDTYDTVVPEYQRHTSIVVAIGAAGLANLDQLLSREMMSNSN